MDLKELGLQPLTVDVNQKIEPNLRAVRGDRQTRGIALKIVKNGKEIDTSGINVDFYAKPRDGNVYHVEAAEIDATKGQYEIIYPAAILQPWKVRCEIKLSRDNQIISTKGFTLSVSQSLATDIFNEAEDEMPLLYQLLEASRNEDERIENENKRIIDEEERRTFYNEAKEKIDIVENKVDDRINSVNAIWVGTLEEYEGLEKKYDNTIYHVIED